MEDFETLSVRGEIMMPKSVRKNLNKEREEEGFIPFANPRNAAAGSIKLLDSKEVARRKLICFVYDILYIETEKQSTMEKIFSNQEEILKWMKSIALPVFDRHKTYKTIEEVIAICKDPATKEFLESQDCDFDGLVIKVVEKSCREIL
jgi:DNA ligase (NAD+)